MTEDQLLRNPLIEPTAAVIAEALGAANNSYIHFLEGLQRCDASMQWRYYNDGKAWLGKGLHQWTTSRGTHKELTAFWLSVWDGLWKITFYIPEKHRDAALCLPLEDDAKEKIESGKQMGNLKFFPVTFEVHSDEWLSAIYTLIAFKAAMK